ncbi:hypothetical protein K8354_10850 [Polaribacter litorisediminis]|uniref:hypothetical protein n=1 Tax=Polaribacter litorisediminis TaxID=1908341 RepID=UPI001CBB2762|nr:hypothetical protein [Polaribacter litorisediminis]UAM96827.1 hypothetical protein K8354_10850 [Polaribacter litorisediminis]
MKRKIKTTILFSLLFITTIYSQNDFFEFTKNIKWFSPQNELLEDYSQNIRKSKHFYNDYDKTIADYKIDSIKLGKYSFEVYFYVDSITKKLSNLKFYLPEEKLKKVDSQNLSKHMDSVFTSKYGEPDIKEDDLGDKISHYDRKWYTENFIVYVSHMVFNDSQFYILNLKGLDNNNSDFRIANWGDSKESIMLKEGKADKAGIDKAYMFEDYVASLDCKVLYIFSNNKLSMSKYIFNIIHTNKNDYIEDFKKLVSIVSEKYGKPSYNVTEWKNSLFKDDIEQYGFAVSLGHLLYNAGWSNDKTGITVALYGENYKTTLLVQFVSKKYEQLKDEADRKQNINKF